MAYDQWKINLKTSTNILHFTNSCAVICIVQSNQMMTLDRNCRLNENWSQFLGNWWLLYVVMTWNGAFLLYCVFYLQYIVRLALYDDYHIIDRKSLIQTDVFFIFWKYKSKLSRKLWYLAASYSANIIFAFLFF